MSSCLLFILLLAPFLASGVIAFHNSQSPWSLLAVLFGAIVGTILIGLVGIQWLYVFHRSWMESQAGGFIFLPVVLPFCAYTGSVTGASLVAILYGYQETHFPVLVVYLIAIGFTVALSGLVPSVIAALPYTSPFSDVDTFATTAISVICGSVASSWLASGLTYLLVAYFYK